MWLDSCGWVRDRLPLLAGDDLLGDDRRHAQRHLLGCPSCRHRLAALRETLAVLQGAAAISPSRPDAPSIWPDLDRQIRESRRPVPSASFAWPRLGLFSAVGLAAGLILAVGLSRAPRPNPSRPSPVDVVETPIRDKAPTLVVHSPTLKPTRPAAPAPTAPAVVQQAQSAKPTAPAEAVVNRRDEVVDPSQATEPTR